MSLSLATKGVLGSSYSLATKGIIEKRSSLFAEIILLISQITRTLLLEGKLR